MDTKIKNVSNYCDADRDGDYEETGFYIVYTSPKLEQSNELGVIVDWQGKVEIHDTVSFLYPRVYNKISKEQFLDLMSKLYDMAEVK